MTLLVVVVRTSLVVRGWERLQRQVSAAQTESAGADYATIVRAFAAIFWRCVEEIARAGSKALLPFCFELVCASGDGGARSSGETNPGKGKHEQVLDREGTTCFGLMASNGLLQGSPTLSWHLQMAKSLAVSLLRRTSVFFGVTFSGLLLGGRFHAVFVEHGARMTLHHQAGSKQWCAALQQMILIRVACSAASVAGILVTSLFLRNSSSVWTVVTGLAGVALILDLVAAAVTHYMLQSNPAPDRIERHLKIWGRSSAVSFVITLLSVLLLLAFLSISASVASRLHLHAQSPSHSPSNTA